MNKINFVVDGLRIYKREGHHLHRVETGRGWTHETCEKASPDDFFCGDSLIAKEDHKKITCAFNDAGITLRYEDRWVADEECEFPRPQHDSPPDPDPDGGDWEYAGLGE